MKILVIVVIFSFLLSTYPVSAQVNNSLIDDFFYSLPTKVYYWRIEETSYAVVTSFNAVVLKRSGLADKYLFQESDILVIEKERKDIKKYLYHYYYLPDEYEQDMKVEIFLPDSQTVIYTDTKYPHIAKAKELNHIELKIDKFSNVLYEYNILYLEEMNYTPGLSLLSISFGLALTGLSFWGVGAVEDDLWKIALGGSGALFAATVIVNGFRTIRDGSKAKPRRAELKRLESTLKDIVNTN
jgi:hypothetical protein